MKYYDPENVDVYVDGNKLHYSDIEDDYIRLDKPPTIEEVMEAFHNGKVISIFHPEENWMPLDKHIAKINDRFMYMRGHPIPFTVPFTEEWLRENLEKNLKYISIKDEFDNIELHL